MVRKSERNKTQGAPEKTVVERTRKSTRQSSRRKKKSSSESEGEPEVPVEKSKEVGEINDSKLTEPQGSDTKQDSVRTRRSVKRQPPAAPQTENEKDSKEQNCEWKEDPSFWDSEAATAQERDNDSCSTWKIQSSNGSGGEIQKLKICRQRVTDSNDSSSPTKEASPRSKKSSRLGKGTDASRESAELSAEVSSDAQEVTSDAQEVTTVSHDTTLEEVTESKDSGIETSIPDVKVDENKDTTQDSNLENMLPDEAPASKDDVESAVNDSACNNSESTDIEKCNKNSSEESTKERSEEIPVAEEQEQNPPKEQAEDVQDSSSRQSSVEKQDSKNESTHEVILQSNEEKQSEEERSNIEEGEVLKADDTTVTEAEEEKSESEQKPDDAEEANSERKMLNLASVKVPVNSELAVDEIAKKLNERAARFSKDVNDNKETKEKEEIVNEEPKSPREEGELTPVLETKKSTHTTIVINRPKEVSSQPTRLKRNTDDTQPKERKRRLVSKPKPKDKEEDPINISSQSLMLLVPEVKTITPEQVASFPLDDEDLSKFEMEQPSEMSTKKKINLKPKDVEVRVQNDTRQVSKKKQIVIDASAETNEMKAVGPKLPVQDNHRVVRKISLLNDDVKKPTRSPSPSGKSPTEVLFITNLVRPFTVPQLRELLARTGTIAPNGFYIDKIKSKCYVKYTDVEMAVETRHALNGVRWPVNNPKMLKVEFATAEDMAVVQKLAEEEVTPKKAEIEQTSVSGWLSEQAALKPQRRVTTAVREWDMGKIGAGPEEKRQAADDWQVKQEPQEVKRRAASPVENKFEPPVRKMKKRDNDAPARLLDDLFRKTKATPCIYWLPLTAAQIAVKEEMRRQHMAEHERRLAELRKTDHSRRDKDREKSRDSRRKK